MVFKSHLPLLTALGFDVRWVLDSRSRQGEGSGGGL